ncbi:MAG TPA: alpha-amylase family glycosyl hydrolase, partial [Rhodopila sp.]|nr:alpha-amylase family glycosyl hydrolase [Rhodopila sp.]
MGLAWWQRGVVYQIYPRSFQDSDGNGIGDLRGITRRLDYLAWLGVDAIWISPIYPSPMTDFGYDVSDYCDVDPLFGTLADMDALIEAAHRRGLKVILDYVPNHTSDRHPWFIESRRNRTNPKRNWYLWRDAAADGGPPNNWRSHFGGPGWSWDGASGQYYYHSFLPTQPDLNWRSPELRAAMFEVLRFWLRRGIDGFRVDVMWVMIKDDQFRDNPPNPGYAPGSPAHDRLSPLYSADRPEVQDLVAGMRAVLDEFEDRVLIGELYLPIERLMAYYGRGGRGAHLPFNFQLLLMQGWHAQTIADIVNRYEAALPPGGWPNWVLGNHDRPRIATRVGVAQARMAALLLLTLRGTPTIYMGDELGMVDTLIPEAEIQDPAEKREPGKGRGRDPQRTPFPWELGPGAGFTTGRPWLRIGLDTPLSAQRDDPGSMVSLYRALLALRRRH